MTEKRKVEVTIGGRNFTVVGNEPEDYIKKISDFVDKNIKEVMGKNTKLSYSMSVTLAAINIVDKYYRTYIELSELRKESKEPIEKYEELKNNFIRMKEELEQLQKECSMYKNELLNAKRENENTTKNVKKYEQALELKEEELMQNQKIVKQLQNKLFENQLELIQTKKELEESLKLFDKEQNVFK